MGLHFRFLRPITKPVRQLFRAIRKPFRRERQQEAQEVADANVEAQNQINNAAQEAEDQAAILKNQRAIVNANLQAEKDTAKTLEETPEKAKVALGDEQDESRSGFKFFADDPGALDTSAEFRRKARNWMR